VSRSWEGRMSPIREGRVSLRAVLHREKPSPCLAFRRPVALRRLVIGLNRDGSYKRAGDGARTRDSLLGRQGITTSPLVCHELPLLARVDNRFEMRASLTKDVARVIWRLRQKMSRKNEGRMSPPRSALEQLYQTFCANSSEAGGLLLHHTPYCLTKGGGEPIFGEAMRRGWQTCRKICVEPTLIRMTNTFLIC
jgi:hypothetical protein